jgi:hypothetical protein
MADVNIQDYQNLLRASIDAKLSTMDSTFSNTIGLQLTKDKLLVWLNEPASLTLNSDLKDKIEQIISSVLYPYWVVKHKAGLTLVPRLDAPPESARAIAYDLHFGIYGRLTVDSISSTNLYQDNHGNLKIALMDDYYWSIRDHLAIMASTRGGKTTLLRYLISNCAGYSKIKVKNGAVDDGAQTIIVIDPKLDGDLRATTLAVGGSYLAPDFSKSDNSYIDQVNTALKSIIDLMRSRADYKKQNPKIKFKDVFVFLDEAITIPALGSTKTRAIYISLLDRVLMMGAGFQIHVVMASQSFIVGTQGAVSSQGRLEFGARILLTSRLTAENVQYLFKDLDVPAINNLILDQDAHGLLSVGICDCEGDGNIVPFKSPYFTDLGGGN